MRAMPELPEVETVRRGLAPVMEGRRIMTVHVRRRDLRIPIPENFASRLEGARLDRLGRRSKYLAAELDVGLVLVMHLGMTGRFTIGGTKLGEYVHDAGDVARHEHVVFQMEGGVRVGYSDPRRFGFMDLWPLADIESYPSFATLGPEPLTGAFSGRYLADVLKPRRTPVKAALLDQTIVAGLGNIYVCEALWRAGISPLREAAAVTRLQAERLVKAIDAVICDAILAGGSSISDFAAADGSAGGFQHSFNVYGREGDPCTRCGAVIGRIVQSGRSTFYCSSCQR
jgi:formamidopyrimidine-DNA glycosylase